MSKYKLLKDLKKGDLIDIGLGKRVTEEVKSNRFIPDFDQRYYFIDSTGSFPHVPWSNDPADRWRLSQGNVFETEKEAVEYKEILKIEGELRMLANDDQAWDGINRHFYIYSGKESSSVSIRISSVFDCIENNFFFKTTQDAKNAIEEIGEDRLIKFFTYGKNLV